MFSNNMLATVSTGSASKVTVRAFERFVVDMCVHSSYVSLNLEALCGHVLAEVAFVEFRAVGVP